MTRTTRLRLGSTILVVGALGLLPASAAIGWGADLTDRTGRHLLAGALANSSVAGLLALLAAGPVRRGERWALWASSLPIVLYGLPVIAIDAAHVERARLLGTIAPPILGLTLYVVGLIILAPAMRGPSNDAAA